MDAFRLPSDDEHMPGRQRPLGEPAILCNLFGPRDEYTIKVSHFLVQLFVCQTSDFFMSSFVDVLIFSGLCSLFQLYDLVLFLRLKNEMNCTEITFSSFSY